MRKKNSLVRSLCLFFLCSALLFNPFYISEHSTNTGPRAYFPPEWLEEEEFIPVIVALADHAALPDNTFDEKDESAGAAALINELQETARRSEKKIQPVLEEEIAKGNLKNFRPFWLVNAFAAQVNAEAFQRLAALPQVESIRPEQQYSVSVPPGYILAENRHDPAANNPISSADPLGNRNGTTQNNPAEPADLAENKDNPAANNPANPVVPAGNQNDTAQDNPAGPATLENVNDPAANNFAGGTGATETLPWNLEIINVPAVWQQGIYGEGVVVAIMDTGVDLNHPALKEHYRGNQPGHSHETSWYDATAGGVQANSEPSDANGHGTHIAGIILGGSPQEPLGVAPGASWIAVNIFNKGHAWDSHIIQAFQWLLAPGGNPQNAPQIINCSWASRPEYVRDNLQWEILHNLERAGILVVFAAGNNGASGPGSPASYPHAFCAGAIQKEGQTVKVTDFSSRGPVSWQGMTYQKPEITAPGVNIRSAWLNNDYTVLDGTSLAAAHVSGAAALLLEANPALTPLEIKYILEQAAWWDPAWDRTGERPNNTYGYGLLNVGAAIARNILPPKETLFFDGAEEGIMHWQTSPDTPWKITRESVSSGNFSLASSPWEQYENNAQSWLSTAEPLSLQGYHCPVLSFEHFYALATGKNKEDDYGYVEISADNKNWVSLYRFSGTNEQFCHFSLPLNLPGGADTFYLRFRLESNNNGPGRGWYLDNITLTATPPPLTKLEGPAAQPVPGTYTGAISLALIPSTPDAKVYYTLDGSEPDEKSMLYTHPLTLTEDKTIKAREYLSGTWGPLQEFPYIIKEGAVLAGSVTLQGRPLVDAKTSVFFTNEETGQVYALPNIPGDGCFSLNLPPGNYLAAAKREQYLPGMVKVNLGTKEEHRAVNLVLLAGDLNNDNQINITDLALLTLAYHSKPGDKHWNPRADLNGDGRIDTDDLAMLTQNFGMRSDP